MLPDSASRAKLSERQSSKYTEKYADYLNLGIEEWRKAYGEHEKLDKKAILFVMTDDTKNCDDVAEYLETTCPDLKDAVLVIYTKNNGEISEVKSGKKKQELEKLRKQSNDIDNWDSPYQAIVSVMMLKEDCNDIISYVKNYMAVHFKIDYVNAKGEISNYYPDFVVNPSL